LNIFFLFDITESQVILMK